MAVVPVWGSHHQSRLLVTSFPRKSAHGVRNYNYAGGMAAMWKRCSGARAKTGFVVLSQKAGQKSKSPKKNDSARKKSEIFTEPTQNSKIAAMTQFSRDENLLFRIVPGQEDALRCIYAFPNEYTVGICSLGYQIIWRQLAESPDVHVARLFTDAMDPLFESPDLLGFSFSWELDYANILKILEDLNLPVNAADRNESHPLVFGGGPVLTTNPEPYSDFFDVVLLGDGEDLMSNFLDAVRATRVPGINRMEKLIALSKVPGVYVPLAYTVEYESPEGPIKCISPVNDSVPPFVKKQTYQGTKLAVSSVVTEKMAWENIFMVEVVRSCPEMCRFCLASYATLPFRSAPVEDFLIPEIENGLQYTDRIGLLGASVTQHPQFDKLLDYVLKPELNHVRLSIASVRTNTVTAKLTEALSSRGTKSLTIAVESGSEKMRRIVNKKLGNEEIVQAAMNAQNGGLEKLKLYGMVGLPGEADSDVLETVEMMKSLRKVAPRLKFTLGVSTFVPKAHTPFQYFGVSTSGEKKLELLSTEMRKLSVDFRPESYKWSVVQSLLSRGDRRLGPLLLLVRSFGDSYGSFRRAFKQMKGQLPPMDYYTQRQIQIGEEVLPWSHLHGPLPEDMLIKHVREAMSHF